MKLHGWASVLCLGVLAAGSRTENGLCLADCKGVGIDRVCTFRTSVDVFASNFGYFRFQGCDGTAPTLGMEADVVYIFDQADPTNWYHPLGFAYGPDGVYGENQELGPSQVPPYGSICGNETLGSCQSPYYKLDNQFLCTPPCEEDFGLDSYEGDYFQTSRPDWKAAGNFSVQITITDNATAELFYFCHIHTQMGGRIRVLYANNTPRPIQSEVPFHYEKAVLTEFDQACGTFNVSQYEKGEGCPQMTFLCESNSNQYAECMVALDCAMHVEMRVSGSKDPTTTFMHQMIAHHRNAVNMAKALLKENPPSLRCGTSYLGRRLAFGEDPDREEYCENGGIQGDEQVVDLLWSIINSQNHQITFMQAWLKDNKEPAFDSCAHSTFPLAIVIVSACSILIIFMVVSLAVYFVRTANKSATVRLDNTNRKSAA